MGSKEQKQKWDLPVSLGRGDHGVQGSTVTRACGSLTLVSAAEEMTFSRCQRHLEPPRFPIRVSVSPSGDRRELVIAVPAAGRGDGGGGCVGHRDPGGPAQGAAATCPYT